MNVSNKKPMVLVIAGPNGSGKSTITSYLQTVGTYTNADDVVRSTGLSTLEAAQFVDKKRYLSIEHKEDFSFETVLSSHHKLELLKKAKENDYFIKCIFILTANPKINIKRVQIFQIQFGHKIKYCLCLLIDTAMQRPVPQKLPQPRPGERRLRSGESAGRIQDLPPRP